MCATGGLLACLHSQAAERRPACATRGYRSAGPTQVAPAALFLWGAPCLGSVR